MRVGAREVGRGRRKTEHFLVLASLDQELGAPSGWLGCLLLDVRPCHVQVPLVDVKRRAATSKQVVRRLIEVAQVADVHEAAVLPLDRRYRRASRVHRRLRGNDGRRRHQQYRERHRDEGHHPTVRVALLRGA